MSESVDELNFEELISRARQGCIESKNRLLVASTSKIEFWNHDWYNFLVRNKLSARDLTQEVVLIAGYSFGQFRGVSENSWYGWLYTIHRRVVSELANRKDLLPLSMPASSKDGTHSIIEDIPSRDLTPGSAVGLREETERVKTILARIDPLLRVTLLYWMEGMTLEEQAEAMKLTLSKVRTLRVHALREFSSQWKNLRESA